MATPSYTPPMIGSKRRRVLYGTSLFVLALLPGLIGILEGRPPQRGANDAGGEFWSGWQADDRRDPYSSNRTIRYLGQRGLHLIRLPLRWERLQPGLGEALEAREVDYVRRYLREAADVGSRVLLDLHNGARYQHPSGELQLGLGGLSIEKFADFWRRLAEQLRDEPGLYGYDLMNEPANMPTDTWKVASQRALDAIRATGDQHRILVPGNNYASAQMWVMCHGRHGWIQDSANNFAYEAHAYLDADGSGRYALSYAEEEARDPALLDRGRDRLRIFTDWCHDNGVRGFIGEFGIPNDGAWLAPLQRMLDFMDLEHLDATMWAAGERWPADYPLSLQPLDDFRRDRGPMRVLLEHNGDRGSLSYDFSHGYVRLWRRLRLWMRDRL